MVDKKSIGLQFADACAGNTDAQQALLMALKNPESAQYKELSTSRSALEAFLRQLKLYAQSDREMKHTSQAVEAIVSTWVFPLPGS